ncbi:MAG: hypothetical protein ACYC0Q_16060 [Eubacteriales bacterium]
MAKNGKRYHGRDKILEPLSSYFPSTFEVNEPNLQNYAPEYRGNGGVYKKKRTGQEKV